MAPFSFDRRRINGPEESFPPVFESEPTQTNPTLPSSRQHRQPGDIRPIFLQPGLISQANGSAYIETAKTKLACAIYGPRQSKNTGFNEKGKLNVEVKFVPFSCPKRRAPLRDAEDRSIAVAIHQALASSVMLELLPKSTIDVFIIVIEADGIDACVASGAVAASTALADAGIELLGLVVSCAACMIGNDVWLDPTEEESKAARGMITLSTMPALDSVTSLWQTGQMSVEDVLKCTEACQQRCTDIHSVVAQALYQHTKDSQ